METKDSCHCSRWSNRLAITLSCIAILLFLCNRYILRDRVSYPGVSFIHLLDGDDGKSLGYIKGEYGTIKFVRRFSDKQTELQLRSDGSVAVEMRDGKGHKITWSLTEDGERFEKSPG